MAGSQVTIAASQLETQRLGYQAISLTNFDNDSEPQIAAGSPVEVAGALFEFPANESISGWGSIGTENNVYIKLVVSGTSVTAEFTTTAPTWSESKQGYYVSLARYIGGLYKDASGNYPRKYLYQGRKVIQSEFVKLNPEGSMTLAGEKIYRDVGKIAPFIVKTPPGWLWCDGSTISKTTNPEYTDLVDLLKAEAGADTGHPYYHADSDKAVLPDLRGAGIRGIDVAANRDKDGVRKSGGYQADNNKSHGHDHGHSFRFQRGAGTGTEFLANDTGNLKASSSFTFSIGGSIASDATASGATEATAKNIALYLLIKY